MKKQGKKFYYSLNSYISVIIIPIVLAGIITVCFFFSKLATDTKSLNYEIMNYTQNMLDSTFSSLISYSFQVRENSSINSVIEMSENGQSINNLTILSAKNEFAKIFADDAIERIGIYLPKSKFFLDKHGRTDFDEFYKFYIEGSEKTPEDFTEILSKSNSETFLLKANGINSKKNLIYLKPLDISKKSSGIIFYTVLNAEILLDRLQYMNVDSKSFAILNSQGEVVFNTGSSDVDINSTAASSPDKAKLENNSSLCVSSKAANCKYIYIYPNGTLSGNVYKFAFWFVILLLSAILFSAILAKKSIGKTISSYVASNKLLNENINRNIEEIKKQKLLNCIYNVKTNNEFDDLTNHYKLGFNSKEFFVICISQLPIDKDASLLSSQNEENIINKIQGFLSSSNSDFNLLNINNANVFVIGLSTFTSKEIANKINSYFSPMDKQITFIGVGDVTDSLETLWRSYDGAMHALRYAKLHRQKNIVFYNNISLYESSKIYFSNEKEISIIKNIKTGSKYQVEELLDELYRVNFLERHLSDSAITRLIAHLVLIGSKISHDIITNDDALEKYDHITEKILKNKNNEESFEMIREFYFMLNEENTTNENNDDFKNEVLEYIRNNFMKQDLSLNMLADHLNMNYYYVSRLFKEAVGNNFASYLTAIRMEKAKEYLENTDMTVKEVSSAVGFTESNSFIRAFKKYYRTTPGKLNIKKEGTNN